MPEWNYHNKIVVITGAASGIGKAAAQQFAECGAKLVLADIDPAVEAVAQSIEAGGGSAIAQPTDAGDPQAVKALCAKALDQFSRVDVMFANAGVLGGFAGLFEQSVEDWMAILRVNLVGAMLAIQEAAPIMQAQGGGAIICTASVAGIRSGAGGAAYSASKAGVINLVQVAAQQLSGSNIRVNAICPGLIETGMTQQIFDSARAKDKADLLGKLNPLRRGGTAEEVASAALFLASDAASYINGHALVVDGGLSSSHPFNRQEFGRTAI